MNQQAYNFVPGKIRSPSNYRSESPSLRLDTESILSVTDSERTISTVESSTLSSPIYLETTISPVESITSFESLSSRLTELERKISQVESSASERFYSRSTIVGSSTSLANSVRTVTKQRVRDSYPTPVYSEDIKIRKILASDIVVLVMGPTGSGKSNFIDNLTGQPGWRAGSHLESCTTEVRAVRIINHATYGDRLVLVDTPGFDDANKSDLEVLEMAGNWLQKVYEKAIKLAGIVYLHRITDNRMAGSPHRNLRMFCTMCGDQAVKKVIIVTTMWDKMHDSYSAERAQGREKDLFKHYWKVMIDHGASTARFDNSPSSAWRIIDTVTNQHKPEVLLLQEELVDLKRSLNETQAGKTLYSDLQKLLAEQRDTVGALAQQARDETNPQLAAQLKTELKRIQRDSEKTFHEVKNLQIPVAKRIILLSSKKSRARPMHIV